jgi:hypothetical protein
MWPTSCSPREPYRRVPLIPTAPARHQPGDGRVGRLRQLVDPGQQHDLGVAVLGEAEPGSLVQGADVRPLGGEAVHAGRGQRAVGVPACHRPAPELGQAGRHESVGGDHRARPVARLRPVQQPADLPSPAHGLGDLLAGAVAQQVGGGHHPAPLLGHQRDPLGDPGVDDELAGVALQLAQHRVDRHRHTRHDGLDVGVDQRGELLAVGAAEGAYLDIGHGGPPRRRRRWREGAGEAATGAVRLQRYQAPP